MRVCAKCGKQIEDDENHYSFLDNYLQMKYFDSEEDNIFCSEECACEGLLLEEITPEERKNKKGDESKK